MVKIYNPAERMETLGIWPCPNKDIVKIRNDKGQTHYVVKAEIAWAQCSTINGAHCIDVTLRSGKCFFFLVPSPDDFDDAVGLLMHGAIR